MVLCAFRVRCIAWSGVLVLMLDSLAMVYKSSEAILYRSICCDWRHAFSTSFITTSIHLHILGRPRVLVHRVLDILHFGFGFFPRRLVPLRPVDVTLRKLHLST